MLKTDQDISDIKEGGAHLVGILKAVADLAKPGVNLLQLEAVAREQATTRGGKPSFLGYRGYPSALCLSPNSTIVHGIPKDYVLKDGDILAVDCGFFFKGWHTDAAITLPIGNISPEAKKLLAGTYSALLAGTDAVKAGNRIGQISEAIEGSLRGSNLTIFRSLVGHGVGRELHEDPMVPNFHSGSMGPAIQDGQTLALEPIAGLGQEEITELEDGWTLETADGALSAHFEHTLIATPTGPIVVTPLTELVDFLKNA